MKKYHLSVRVSVDASSIEEAQREGFTKLMEVFQKISETGHDGWQKDSGIQLFLPQGEIVLLEGDKLPPVEKSSGEGSASDRIKEMLGK